MSNQKHETPWVVSVAVVVSDREAAKRWYTKKLGLSLTRDDGHWITVGGREQGSVLHLCQASENPPTGIPLEPGPSGIALALSGDFQAECARLKRVGVEFSHEPEEESWGWYAFIRDPDGNEHCLRSAP